MRSSEEFSSKQQSLTQDLCVFVCLRMILNQVENITILICSLICLSLYITKLQNIWTGRGQTESGSDMISYVYTGARHRAFQQPVAHEFKQWCASDAQEKQMMTCDDK